MEKKIAEIIKERFVNNEFDVKSNLSFYKQNKSVFHEMVRRGIITKNIGGKVKLIENPKPIRTKFLKNWKKIMALAAGIGTLLGIVTNYYGVYDRIIQNQKAKKNIQMPIHNEEYYNTDSIITIQKTDSLTKI